MIGINAIASLIMLAALIPTAKLIRKGISGLVNAVGGGGGDPAEEGMSGAGRNAMMVARSGLRGKSSGGGSRNKGKTDNTPNRSGKSESNQSYSSSYEKGQDGHLPEKRNAGSRNGTFAQAQDASPQTSNGYAASSASSAGGAEAEGYSASGATTAGGFQASHGDHQHTGPSANNQTGSTTMNQNTGNSQTRSALHQKPKQSLGTRTKKGASTGAKIGNALSKVPLTAVGMATSVPFGGAAGSMVAKGGNMLGKGAGGAIGGATALAAHGGGKVAKSSIKGMSNVRGKVRQSTSGTHQKSGGSGGMSGFNNRTVAQNPSLQRHVQRGSQKQNKPTQNSSRKQNRNQAPFNKTIVNKTIGGNNPKQMRSIKNVDTSGLINNQSHLNRPE